MVSLVMRGARCLLASMARDANGARLTIPGAVLFLGMLAPAIAQMAFEHDEGHGRLAVLMSILPSDV